MAGTRVVVVCVRHGETNFNREKRLQGQLDTELSELGVRQAALTASHLARQYGAGFDRVVSSDLRRAFETATSIARAAGLEASVIAKDPRLRELHVGVLQGATVADSRRDPEKAQIVSNFSSSADYAIPEGESRRAMYHRASAALEQTVLDAAALPREATSSGTRRVLLVAHGGVLSVLYSFVKSLDLDRDHPPHASNCSIGTISALVLDGAVLSWEITSWNTSHHLQSDATVSDVL